jgi:hypothetical protein
MTISGEALGDGTEGFKERMPTAGTRVKPRRKRKQRDHSRDDMVYATRLANKGYSAERIAACLGTKPSRSKPWGSVKYHAILETRGMDAANAYARRTAEKAVTWVLENPAVRDPSSALVRIFELEATAWALPWNIYGGAGALRALEAGFLVAERAHSLKIGLSLREWAELAGMDKDTMVMHRGTLVDLGWMMRNPDDDPGRTSRFTIRRPSHIQFTRDMNVGSPNPSDRAWLNHDAFVRGGVLDDLGWYVLRVAGRTSSYPALCAAAGLGPDDGNRLCGRLSSFGLLRLGDDHFTRADNLIPLLDVCSSKTGVAGHALGLRLRHAQDRASFRSRRDLNVGDGHAS